MQTHDGSRRRRATFAAAGIFLLALAASLIATRTTVLAQHRMHGVSEKPDRNHPWMNPKLSPDDQKQKEDIAYRAIAEAMRKKTKK